MKLQRRSVAGYILGRWRKGSAGKHVQRVPVRVRPASMGRSMISKGDDMSNDIATDSLEIHYKQTAHFHVVQFAYVGNDENMMVRILKMYTVPRIGDTVLANLCMYTVNDVLWDLDQSDGELVTVRMGLYRPST